MKINAFPMPLQTGRSIGRPSVPQDQQDCYEPSHTSTLPKFCKFLAAGAAAGAVLAPGLANAATAAASGDNVTFGVLAAVTLGSFVGLCVMGASSDGGGYG